MRILFPIILAGFLSGCIAKTAADVVTFPVRAAAQGVDWATTSQEEADRNLGRKVREEREREEERREEAEEARREAARRAARDD